MANFNPPFSNSADLRYPTSDERSGGFECGPADRELFNGLFHRLESEVGAVIDGAGIVQDDGDLTQLYQAIQALINAATGGGDPNQFLLVAQARARLPIFPETQTADGRINVVTNGTGSIRVPGGITFLHRGIFPVVTAQTDFATSISKTYHLRWNPTDGFQLMDLTDPAYNPTTAPESSPIFDSTYDNMLVSRIVTNSSNLATITNLVNKDKIKFSYTRDYLVYGVPGHLGVPSVSSAANEIISYNFARTPMFVTNGYEESGGVPNRAGDGDEGNLYANNVTRYSASVFAYAYDIDADTGFRPRYAATFLAIG